MSLNKIAKAINNLAESIRYHADNAGKPPMTGHSHGSVKGATTPQNIPKYEGKEVEHPIASIITQDCDGFATSAAVESKCYEAEGFGATGHVEAADGLNADTPGVNDPQFIAGFEAGWVPAFGSVIPTPPAEEADRAPDFSDDVAIDNYVDPYDKPALDVPDWQTLTVEELDAAPPPPPSGDAAPSTPSEHGVTVDANGLPWDARIHSSGKTLLADDTWRLKRGVPDDEREAIEAELKQLMAIPVPPVSDAVAPPPPVPAVDSDSQAAEVAPPPPTAKITLMPQLIKAITGAELGAMIVTEAVKSVGLENISQLGARPDLVPAVAEELGL